MKLFDIKWEKKPPFFHITLDSLYRILMQFMSIGILGFIMESTLEYIFQGYFEECKKGLYPILHTKDHFLPKVL